jgi:hypothetical protein
MVTGAATLDLAVDGTLPATISFLSLAFRSR